MAGYNVLLLHVLLDSFTNMLVEFGPSILFLKKKTAIVRKPPGAIFSVISGVIASIIAAQFDPQ